METNYGGIDYGLGRSNIGAAGIRYGVINQSDVGQAWYEDSEPIYYYICPKCDYEIGYHFCSICPDCKEDIEESFDMLEPIGYIFEDTDYSAECSDDMGDIFVTRSPYFTYAQYCSPCAPGAGYLMNFITDPGIGPRAYCFGHDWFETEVAPYPVYSVETGKLVKP